MQIIIYTLLLERKIVLNHSYVYRVFDKKDNFLNGLIICVLNNYYDIY